MANSSHDIHISFITDIIGFDDACVACMVFALSISRITMAIYSAPSIFVNSYCECRIGYDLSVADL